MYVASGRPLSGLKHQYSNVHVRSTEGPCKVHPRSKTIKYWEIRLKNGFRSQNIAKSGWKMGWDFSLKPGANPACYDIGVLGQIDPNYKIARRGDGFIRNLI